MRPDYGWEGPKLPRKWIEEREQSAPAICVRRMKPGSLCGEELRLHIGASPLPEYRELVTQTCLAGHIQRVQGVLTFQPEQWAEDGPVGL